MDQPVQPPEPADRRGGASVRGVPLDEVGGMSCDGRVLPCEPGQACLVTARGEHVRALESTTLRDRLPDAGRGSGNQDGVPIESAHGRYSLRSQEHPVYRSTAGYILMLMGCRAGRCCGACGTTKNTTMAA